MLFHTGNTTKPPKKARNNQLKPNKSATQNDRSSILFWQREHWDVELSHDAFKIRPWHHNSHGTSSAPYFHLTFSYDNYCGCLECSLRIWAFCSAKYEAKKNIWWCRWRQFSHEDVLLLHGCPTWHDCARVLSSGELTMKSLAAQLLWCCFVMWLSLYRRVLNHIICCFSMDFVCRIKET